MFTEHFCCQKQYVKVDISTNMIYPQPLQASKDIKGHLATRQFCIIGTRRGLKDGSANFALLLKWATIQSVKCYFHIELIIKPSLSLYSNIRPDVCLQYQTISTPPHLCVCIQNLEIKKANRKHIGSNTRKRRNRHFFDTGACIHIK